VSSVAQHVTILISSSGVCLLLPLSIFFLHEKAGEIAALLCFFILSIHTGFNFRNTQIVTSALVSLNESCMYKTLFLKGEVE
jgi:hypothetical protein